MADGGEAARDMALASPPDLVISDVRMPGIDGIELLRAASRRAGDARRAA